MIERVNQRQCRCTIESPAVIQGRGDADRRLVDVRDAEVDFPHLGQSKQQALRHRAMEEEIGEDGIPSKMRKYD